MRDVSTRIWCNEKQRDEEKESERWKCFSIKPDLTESHGGISENCWHQLMAIKYSWHDHSLHASRGYLREKAGSEGKQILNMKLTICSQFEVLKITLAGYTSFTNCIIMERVLSQKTDISIWIWICNIWIICMSCLINLNYFSGYFYFNNFKLIKCD